MICKSCNKEERGPENFIKSKISDLMRKEHICFTCAFWEIHARDFETGKDKESVFIVNHNRYHDGGTVNKKTTRGFLGYGGANWKIRMLETNEIKETNNLWHQGEIPEHFRHRLPDNAEFLR